MSVSWLSNDPIGISGGLNQYVFCANNPVNFRDPEGDEPRSVDLGEGYTGRPDSMHGPGGTTREHLHVFRNGEEVAKINTEGGWMRSHKGNPLLRPSQVPGSVRNRINSIARKFGRLNMVILPLGLLDDLDLYLRGREQGRSYNEQLEDELRNAGPYIDTWLGPMPNPFFGQGKKKCPSEA